MFPILIFAVSLLLSMLSNGYTATYYVAKTGSDGNSCANAQSQSTPRRTINIALQCLSSGDTLTIRGGTYPEYICPPCGFAPVPSGGGESSRTIIQGAPGETVVLAPPLISDFGNTIQFDTGSYITIQNLIIDGSNYTGPGGGSLGKPTHHIRFKDIETRYQPWGVFESTGDYNEWINVYIHHFGQCTQFGACGYPFYASGNYLLWDRVTIDATTALYTNMYCFHIYDAAYTKKVGLILRNSSMRGCSGPSIATFNTVDMVIENNVIYGGKSVGIGLSFGSSNTTVRNNTIYGQTGPAIDLSNGTGSTTVIQNNIISGNQGVGISINEGSAVTVQNNLSSNNSGGNCTDSRPSQNACAGSGNLFGNNYNPQFVNVSTRDFHLQSSSPAIDLGLTIRPLTTDKDGVTRPQGKGYDIGAYEYRTSTLSPPANFRVIDMSK